MKKSKLLKSTFILTTFYMGLGLLGFSFAPPMQVYGMLTSLEYPYQARVPELPKPEEITILDQLPLQMALVRAWTVPVVMLWFIALCVGLVGVVIYIYAKKRGMDTVLAPKKGYRAVKASLGEVPTPYVPPKLPREVRFGNVPITPQQQALANEIFSMLAAHQNTYTGPGHGVGLYDHSLNVCKQMIEDDDCDAMMLLATAAHDLGKITKEAKDASGKVFLLPGHAQESARLLSAMESWARLGQDERELLRLAVKFEHDPDSLPMVTRPPRDAVMGLMKRLKRSDRIATSMEKAVVMSKVPDHSEIAYAAFDTALSMLPLRGRARQDNVTTCGFRKGDRLYLLEQVLREKVLLGYLPKDVAAAWELKFREGGNLHPFTESLLDAFDRRGWLVKEADLRENPDPAALVKHHKAKDFRSALWTVWSGNKSSKDDTKPWSGMHFNGVIVIDMPPPISGRAPSQEINFEVCIVRPTIASEVQSDYEQKKRMAEMEKQISQSVQSGKAVAGGPAALVSDDVSSQLFAKAVVDTKSKDGKKKQEGDKGKLARKSGEAAPSTTATTDKPPESGQDHKAIPKAPSATAAVPESAGMTTDQVASALVKPKAAQSPGAGPAGKPAPFMGLKKHEPKTK